MIRRSYNTNSDIRFKTTMLKASLSDYSDAYILLKGTITVTGEGADAAIKQVDERNKGIIFKTCSPFIYCKSEINNTEIGNAKDNDVAMPIIIPKHLEIYGNITKMSPR